MTQNLTVDRNKIRQFKCNNCGGELELQNKQSQFVACPYCGSVADSSSEAYKILTKMENPSMFPPMSFIKIGMEGVINGKVHHVVGRTRRRNTYREYWVEDGESGYSNETWILDEWQLISEDATYLTIVEDNEGFHLVKQIIPKYPTMPRGEYMKDFFNNSDRRVAEYGDTEIMFFEGESTYMIQVGDKSRFSEYSDGDSSFSAEWRFKNGEVKEIEFFEEKPISEYILAEIFNVSDYDESQPDKQQPQVTKKTRRLKNRYILLVGAIINIILGFMLSDNVVTTQNFRESFNINDLAKKQSWINVNDTLKGLKFSRKVNLREDTKVIEIYYTANLADSTECLADISMMDENNDTLFFDTDYSYNYKYSDTLYADKSDFLLKKYLRDSTLTNFTVNLFVKVPKTWRQIQKKPNGTETQHNIECTIGLDELNSVSSEDRGDANMNLGVFLLIFSVVIMAIRYGK